MLKADRPKGRILRWTPGFGRIGAFCGGLHLHVVYLHVVWEFAGICMGNLHATHIKPDSSLANALLSHKIIHCMMKRMVVPEMLDSMPPDDLEAMRSRRDLRRINRLMGNDNWICRSVRNFPAAAALGIVEIGAGDGVLCHRLRNLFPASPMAAYDLAPAPLGLTADVIWYQGDIFTMPPPDISGVLVANLFIHHFEGDSLLALGRWVSRFEVMIISEPDRARLPHGLGGLLYPFINRVTRHDMHVSIRAGFSAGEMMRLMGLDEPGRQFQENSTWRGSRRVIGWRS